ncbi:MAG: histidinol-phosphatase HisJ family protein [Candidatus Omnitrophica bacterium]|nr:histidinol-phosphatase HisJ family protein [Candidatus Omnitrophota bacterium]
MHTALCGHATGSLDEYVRHAIDTGLKEIGFSDHAPMVHERLPGVTMDLRQLPLYHRLIDEVKAKYEGRITIKYALEADFIPGFEAKTKAIIDAYPYDYIIGSVHYVNGWAVDDPAAIEHWKTQDINNIWREYFRLLRQSAQTGLFNTIGHCDLPKKFGHRATVDMSAQVKATAQVFKECRVAIEINTSGLRKPIKEMYPCAEHLNIYCAAGVPLVFGSDAHTPGDVGKNFKEAVDLAKTAGYKEYLIFNKRNIERKQAL